MLKMELEEGWGAPAARKDGLKVFHGLQQRIAVGAGRGCLFAAKPGAYQVQLPAQSPPQPVHCFQREGQPEFFHRRFERTARQQAKEQLPKQRRGEGVARQNLRQTNRKGSSATAAPAAIGAEHPLAPNGLGAGLSWIVAAKDAVPVQRANSLAVRARLLLERKSCVFRSWSPRTK